MRGKSRARKAQRRHSPGRCRHGFRSEAINILEADGVKRTRLREHGEPYRWHRDQYDNLANLVVEFIGAASWIKTPEFISWEVQHNAIWAKLFNFEFFEDAQNYQFKVRRRLYEEIKSIEKFPNFKNARYLGYCLNISGMALGPHKRAGGDYVFRKAIINWTKKHYLWMVQHSPKVANAVLIARLSFDPKDGVLVKTYEEGIREKAPQQFLKLDPPPKT